MKEFLCSLRQKMGKLDLDIEVIFVLLKNRDNIRKAVNKRFICYIQVFVWIMKNKSNLDGLCCPLKPIIASPVITHYRNKSEFTVGKNTIGDMTVGYRLGKYR